MSEIVPLDVERSGRSPYRRRHARQTLTFLALVATVLAVGLVAYLAWSGTLSLGGDGRPTARACPVPVQTAASSVETSLRVYNASNRRGLASTAAREMQLRGFRVPEIGNAPDGTTVPGPMQIRYGATGEPNARTVAAQLLDTPQLVLDEARTDASVDLLLGQTFRGFRTVPQALTLLAPAPVPSPEGCIPDDTKPRPLVNDPRPPKPAAEPTS